MSPERQVVRRLHCFLDLDAQILPPPTTTTTIMMLYIMPLLTIAHVAALIAAADSGCHPAYISGNTYSHGDWVSVSFVQCSPPTGGVNTNDCPDSGLRISAEGGGLSSSKLVYNFQCISPDDGAIMCSKDEYAPGFTHSELVWARESSPCTSVSHINYSYLCILGPASNVESLIIFNILLICKDISPW